MPNTTSRFGINTPLGTEAPNTNAAYKEIADKLDALGAIYGQGVIGDRPVSTPGSPGKAGRFYIVTATTGGGVIGATYYDYGTGWYQINPDQTPADGSITEAKLAANAVTQTKILDGAVTTSKIPDAAITAAKLAAALKPSQGAGAATEALRALGLGAGLAAPGTHASQHGPAGADRVVDIQRVATLGAATAYEGALAQVVNGQEHKLFVYDDVIDKWVSVDSFFWSFTAAARGAIWRGGQGAGGQPAGDYHDSDYVTDLGPWMRNKVWRDAGARPQVRGAAVLGGTSPQTGRYHTPLWGWNPPANPVYTGQKPINQFDIATAPTTVEWDWVQFDPGDYEYIALHGSIAGSHDTLAGGAYYDFWELRWVSA